MLFKIRDASGERKYLITASNLTELKLTLNKFDQKILKFVKSLPLARVPPPPTGFTLIGA